MKIITIDDLPKDILQEIFLFLNDATQNRFYLRTISLVCKKWRNAACIRRIIFRSHIHCVPSQFFSVNGEHLQSIDGFGEKVNLVDALIGTCPKLAHLSIRCESKDVEKFISIIETHPFLTSLDLKVESSCIPLIFPHFHPKTSLTISPSNMMLLEEVSLALANYICSTFNIVSGVFKGLSMTETTSTSFYLATIPNMDFSFSSITPKFGFELITLNKHLTTLSLHNAYLEDKHLERIMAAMEINTTIDTLILSHNPFEESIWVAKMLLRNKTLTFLDLRSTFISDVDISAIFEAFVKNDTIKLMPMTFDWSQSIGDMDVLQKCLPRIGGAFQSKLKEYLEEMERENEDLNSSDTD